MPEGYPINKAVGPGSGQQVQALAATSTTEGPGSEAPPAARAGRALEAKETKGKECISSNKQT